MIILTSHGKYRPGEDDTLDEEIHPTFNTNHDNYMPSRAEPLDDSE